MAIYKEDIATINLEVGNIFRSFVKHTIGTADNAADRFGIRVMRGEEEVDLSGCSCYGYFRDPHGNNIALTSQGTVDGNVAYVTLPQACYNYEGQFCLSIKLIGGGVTGTMRIVDGVIDNTNTGSAAAPTGTVPTYSEILSQYDAMVAATAAANGCIAETFDATKVYKAGKYVINSGALYRLTADHAANTTWANTSKVEVKFGNELYDAKNAFSDFVNEDTVRQALDWTAPGDSTYPNGWSKGYYNASTGESVTSNVYIKTLATYYFEDENATILKAAAPGGYYIAAYEYTGAGVFVKRIGDPNPSNSTATQEIFLAFEKGHKFRFALGKFSNQSDAESHYGDSDFIESIKAEFYTVKADAAVRQINTYIEDGNNMLPLKKFPKTTRSGVDISIENGVLTLYGTASANIRMKLSGDYELATTAPSSWKNETVEQFESGKTYSLHNQVISGNLPTSAGVSLRNSSGSSVVSASIPEATLSAGVAYAMLYIPNGTQINVSYIPMFIEGHATDEAYSKKLNPVIHVDGVKKYEKPDLTADFIYNSEKESAIKLPANYKTTGEKTPLIILAHGLSSTINSSTWGGTDMQTLVNNFVNEGFAVIDVNQVTTQDWCNPALIEKYVAAIRSAMSKYNVSPVAIYGESMGSLICLCLAKLYSTVKVCAIGGIRLDFAARYAEMSSANKAIVDTNLGFTDGFDAYKAAGWDKTAFASIDTNNNKICHVQFPPTFFVVGSTDTLTKTESLAKIDEIKRGGTICKTTEYTGDHNDVCYLKPAGAFADVIAWFEKWL